MNKSICTFCLSNTKYCGQSFFHSVSIDRAANVINQQMDCLNFFLAQRHRRQGQICRSRLSKGHFTLLHRPCFDLHILPPSRRTNLHIRSIWDFFLPSSSTVLEGDIIFGSSVWVYTPVISTLYYLDVFFLFSMVLMIMLSTIEHKNRCASSS